MSNIAKLMFNAAAGAGGEKIYATFDPDNLGSTIALSNGNLTATPTGSGRSIAPANVFKTSGKWYFELTVDTADRMHLGIYEEGDSIEEYAGYYVGENTLGYEPNSDRMYVGGVLTYPLGSTFDQTAGSVHALALDLDAGTLDYYNNGTLGGRLQTGISGSWTFHFCDVLLGGSIVTTANFGATPFTYTPPSGFSGLYE